jgi:hypothetical protein
MVEINLLLEADPDRSPSTNRPHRTARVRKTASAEDCGGCYAGFFEVVEERLRELPDRDPTSAKDVAASVKRRLNVSSP